MSFKEQQRVWEKEYRNPQMLSRKQIPHADVVRFAKWYKKEIGGFEGKTVLDLGSGTGRNSFYFAERDASVIGYEASLAAIEIARQHAAETGLSSLVAFSCADIGSTFDCPSDSVDIILDITSSNSLNEAQRQICLVEMKRVLKEKGIICVRALAKDGDKNVKAMLEKFPGEEKDTYVHPDLGITERVFSKEDFYSLYGAHFSIVHFEKTTHYTSMNNRSYKRNYFVAYLAR